MNLAFAAIAIVCFVGFLAVIVDAYERGTRLSALAFLVGFVAACFGYGMVT